MTIEDLKNNYAIIDHIARGGQKDVYKVADKSGKQFVIKIINNSTDERVLQEVDILRKLDIVNVPKIIDVGTVYDGSIDQEVMYIVEELIEGTSLRDYLSSGNKLTLSDGCKLLETLLNIEVILENNNIIHRDIKPDTVGPDPFEELLIKYCNNIVRMESRHLG